MKDAINFVVANYSLIIIGICFTIYIVKEVVAFCKYPKEKQIVELKARLLAWVTDTENQYGGSTGEIKRADVYNKFCNSFPYLKTLVGQDEFDKMLDEALAEMKKVLADKANKESK